VVTGTRLDHLQLAHRLADAAAVVQRRHFRTPVAVDTKPDSSPVTIADREAETAMRELIQAAFPEHGIYGEEHGAVRADAEHVWVLDPIDGTKSFITGRPLFGTLIGLLHHGRPVLGIIDHSILGERWVGCEGAPTTHNGGPVRVRDCGALADAALFATSPRQFAKPADRAAFDRVEHRVRLPMYGSDCYHYGLLAMGFADLVIEASLEPYDFVAAVAVVEGAGGRITDWQGRPLGLASDGRIVASGDARMHDAALAVLADAT